MSGRVARRGSSGGQGVARYSASAQPVRAPTMPQAMTGILPAAGSQSWIERIYQPLTHPYVLRRDWPRDDIWTDENEVEARELALGRLILGLTRRCRERIYLATSELSEQGYEQQGPLLQAVQRILREHRGQRP